MCEKIVPIALMAFWFITGIVTYFILIKDDDYKHLKGIKGFMFMVFFGLLVASALLSNKNKQLEKERQEARKYRGY